MAYYRETETHAFILLSDGEAKSLGWIADRYDSAAVLYDAGQWHGINQPRKAGLERIIRYPRDRWSEYVRALCDDDVLHWTPETLDDDGDLIEYGYAHGSAVPPCVGGELERVCGALLDSIGTETVDEIVSEYLGEDSDT